MQTNPSQVGELVDLPDLHTLAHLAAQLRFRKLPPEQAALAALELWRACTAALASERRAEQQDTGPNFFNWRWVENLRISSSKVPFPKNWPATSDDFYRLVVRAKDETENQPRFKRFLRDMVEKVQMKLRDCIKQAPKSESSAETLASEIEGEFNLLDSPEAMEEEVERRFAAFKKEQFNGATHANGFPTTWEFLASAYLDWWESEKIQQKRLAGKASAEAKSKSAAKPKENSKKESSGG